MMAPEPDASETTRAQSRNSPAVRCLNEHETMRPSYDMNRSASHTTRLSGSDRCSMVLLMAGSRTPCANQSARRQPLLHRRGRRSDFPCGRHPFAYLNSRVTDHLRAGEPVISVDTKKKELVGDFHNGGREWQPSGQPEPVRVHDFIDPGLGKAIPYGIYDLSNDEGWVSVGDTADTAEFAGLASIRRWWHQMGQHRFGDAPTRLLITADAGGSNGYRIRAMASMP